VSPTYLYCITAPAAPGPTPATIGVDGAAVRQLGPAWVSDVETRPVRATVDRIRAHDAVVAAALDTGVTPLPARFGQVFASDDDCEQAISARMSELSAALARISGMVEMTLLLRAEEVPASERSSGTAYLESLARRERAEDALRHAARGINAQLAGYVRETAERTSGGVLTLSHLIERDALGRYRDRAEALIGDLHATIVGPTAPYSFGHAE
jgi:Gas vesicle synthesis protein GvpL/GvpF